MSEWCKKCNKTTFNEKVCDHCGQDPRDDIKRYNAPKNNGARILNSAGLQNETITLNKNTILIGALVIIAISVGYLAFNKYQEKRQMEELTEMFVGTSDPDEIKKLIKKQSEMFKQMRKQAERAIN